MLSKANKKCYKHFNNGGVINHGNIVEYILYLNRRFISFAYVNLDLNMGLLSYSPKYGIPSKSLLKKRLLLKVRENFLKKNPRWSPCLAFQSATFLK